MSSTEYVNELLGSIECRELCDFICATAHMKSSLFWDFTQCRLVVCTSVSGQTIDSIYAWIARPLRMGPIGR